MSKILRTAIVQDTNLLDFNDQIIREIREYESIYPSFKVKDIKFQTANWESLAKNDCVEYNALIIYEVDSNELDEPELEF